MLCVSLLHTGLLTPDDVPDLVERAVSGLDAQDPSLVTVFVSGQADGPVRALLRALGAAWPGVPVAGCTAEGVIAQGREIERAPAVAVFAAALPGAEVSPVRLVVRAHGEDEIHIEGAIGVTPGTPLTLLAFADPFSFDIRASLDHAGEHWPDLRVSGGFASAGRRPRENRLFLGEQILDEGLVGLLVRGAVSAETVVSQGCRPIGQPMVVTGAEGNVLRRLKGQPPLEVLNRIAATLPDEERELIRHGLFLGRAINEYQSRYERGDFLIQGILGVDPETGSMAVGGEVRVGTTVQFHVRDAVSADEDLRLLLQGRARPPAPAGALLFSCNGRGTHMWTDPDHDVGVLHEVHPGLPVAGFFAAGEFGPVGGRSFVHGFTASLVFFRSS